MCEQEIDRGRERKKKGLQAVSDMLKMISSSNLKNFISHSVFCLSSPRRGGGLQERVIQPNDRRADRPADRLNEAAPGASEDLSHVLICSIFYFLHLVSH